MNRSITSEAMGAGAGAGAGGCGGGCDGGGGVVQQKATWQGNHGLRKWRRLIPQHVLFYYKWAKNTMSTLRELFDFMMRLKVQKKGKWEYSVNWKIHGKDFNNTCVCNGTLYYVILIQQMTTKVSGFFLMISFCRDSVSIFRSPCCYHRCWNFKWLV